jgi:hypothetical protein
MNAPLLFWTGIGIAAYALTEMENNVKKTFISFDFDNDETLKTFLVGQAKHPDSPFEIIDWSIKEHLTGDWKAKARTRIQSADIVAIICGQRTHTASGVAAELQIAKELGKPYFLLQGYSDGYCTKPTTAHPNDKIYQWTWANLKALIGGAR